MSSKPALPSVELEVRDFGPIAEAKLDLRPLTVFVGPSNTGKTYLATLIYALHQFLSGHRSVVGPRYGFSPRLFAGGDGVALEGDRADVIAQWLDGLRGSRAGNGSEQTGRFPPAVEAVITEDVQRAYANGAALTAELSRCFGIPEDLCDLARVGSRDQASIHLGLGASKTPDGGPLMEWDFRFGSGEPSARSTIRSQPALEFTEQQARLWLEYAHAVSPNGARQDASERAGSLSVLMGQVARDMLPQLIGAMDGLAHYLPADRAGVMHAHRAIVGAIVRSAPMAGLRPASDIPSVSGVVADFLDWLINIDEQQSPRFKHGSKPATQAVAERMERNILQGKIEQELTEAGYPSYFYRPDGWERQLPLINTSSMVSELAPVVLFVRNIISLGDTLIIDEPEAHLHPAIQAEFAVELARLVNAGVRVLVTTHSSWMVDQFANLVRLNDLPLAERQDLPHRDVTLGRADVGVWAFTHGAKGAGAEVTELPFDSDGIGFEPGYLDIADEQYNEWATVGNRLADKRIG